MKYLHVFLLWAYDSISMCSMGENMIVITVTSSNCFKLTIWKLWQGSSLSTIKLIKYLHALFQQHAFSFTMTEDTYTAVTEY